MNAQPTGKRPLWRRIVRAVVLTAVCLFVIALAARAVWRYVVARQLREEIAKIQAAGEPLTFKDLDADLPKVDEADDAGRYYGAALALLRHKESAAMWDAYRAYRDASRKTPTSQPAGEVVEKINRLLADNELIFDMLDRGARCPGCRFDIGIEQGIAVCMDRLSQARTAARLLSLRTLVGASGGDSDRATDSVISLLRMTRMFDRQPILIVDGVKGWCLALASQDVKIILEGGQLPEASLQKLQQALLRVEFGKRLSRMAVTERVYGLQVMRDQIIPSLGAGPLLDRPDTLPERWPKPGFWNSPGLQQFAVSYLRDLSNLVNASRQPWPQVLDTMQAATSRESRFSASQFSSYARVGVLTAQSMALTRSALVCVMVERYRRANGKLPASLGGLVPTYVKSLPLDPFTGKDLLYRHDEQAYVVYSVGEDRKDNDGDVDAKEKCKRPIDVGARIRSLPAR